MSIKGKALIAGVYEHPLRTIPDRSVAQVHADVAIGALEDAGLSLSDVDGFASTTVPGLGVISMAEYLGLNKLSWCDNTQIGGSSYMAHVGHAAAAIATGKCSVALVTLAGMPRAGGQRMLGAGGPMPAGAGRAPAVQTQLAPEGSLENPFGAVLMSQYALAARRHMHEFGTTSEQLAWIRVAASQHAQHNPHALFRDPVTVDDVLNSPMVSDPLHRLDCCVITDGGGAVVVVSPEVARDLDRTCVKILGHGEAPKHANNGRIDLTHTGAVWSGPRAFEEAGCTPSDIDYVSIYDSFTITVLETLEDLGFCEKGKGGAFVSDGALIAPDGKLPFNTDGGGLCNNHPANQGGMTKIIEAVRQLRGEANGPTQVRDCELALAHGTGGFLGTRMGSATVILGRDE